MLSTLRKFLPFILLFVVELLVFAANYKAGTFLVGWDNLYPELNLLENLKRNVFSVWQEYRGTGVLDGMAHSANLPHTLVVSLLSIFLPLSFVRYAFVFLMHFLGGVGCLILLRLLLRNRPVVGVASTIGALFYMLNLGVVQMFFAPLEVFVIHFAALPWLSFLIYRYLELPSFKNLLLFAGVSLLTLPQAFVPQVFLAYLSLVFFISLSSLRSLGRLALKRLAVIWAVIILFNSIWSVPYVYSALNNSGVILEAKINQMSSQDVYLKNKERGDLFDVLYLKGFMLDVTEYDDKGKSVYIMQAWRDFTNNWFFIFSATIFSLLAVIGLAKGIGTRYRETNPFVLVFLFCFAVLASNTIPFSWLNNAVRNGIPVLGEAFRFSFTKFVILFALAYSIFLSLGLSSIATWLKDEPKRRAFVFLVGVLIFICSLPIFFGNLFHPQIRLDLPKEYLSTVDFFEKQDASRVAILPQPTFWSWRFNDWGYRGSGFLWYGIKQPTLDRAFDPWSRQSENYYWEISQAIYSKNSNLFEKVLEKYGVGWVILDESILNPASEKALHKEELKTLLSSNKFTLEKEEGKLKIYRVNLETPVNQFVTLANNLPRVSPNYKWGNLDRGYLDLGNYISADGTDVFFPFRSLFTSKDQSNIEFSVEDSGEHYIFKKKVPSQYSEWKLALPDLSAIELIWVDPNDLTKSQVVVPEIMFDGKFVTVKFPKINGYFGTEINPADEPSIKAAKNCDTERKGSVKNQTVLYGETRVRRIIAKNTNNCSTVFYLENLPHATSYLISVQSRNIKGKSLLAWLENLNSHRPDLETYLPASKAWTTSYLIQPPMENDAAGYSLHFDNISIGQQETVNDLRKVSIYPFPYKLLTSMYLHPGGENLQPQQLSSVEVQHSSPSLYQLTIQQSNNSAISHLVLSQAYHDGWKAYAGHDGYLSPLLGSEIKDHVKVNNWENGWKLPENTTKVTILFWPQYLQFLGYFLVVGGIIGLVIFRRRLEKI